MAQIFWWHYRQLPSRGHGPAVGLCLYEYHVRMNSSAAHIFFSSTCQFNFSFEMTKYVVLFAYCILRKRNFAKTRSRVLKSCSIKETGTFFS